MIRICNGFRVPFWNTAQVCVINLRIYHVIGFLQHDLKHYIFFKCSNRPLCIAILQKSLIVYPASLGNFALHMSQRYFSSPAVFCNQLHFCSNMLNVAYKHNSLILWNLNTILMELFVPSNWDKLLNSPEWSCHQIFLYQLLSHLIANGRALVYLWSQNHL